jgi:peptidoglycan/LPS O-acetylase OafA/YrhL
MLLKMTTAMQKLPNAKEFTILARISLFDTAMKSVDRQNNYNLLRFVLALLVLFGHSPELIDGNRSRDWLAQTFGSISFGELAVDGFFLLSGYLIAQSWDSQPHAWPFLKKRLLRIFPGFIVSSIICALIVGPLASDPSAYFGSFQVIPFITTLLRLGIPAVPEVFAGTPYPYVNGAMWTIAKEFVCYLFVLVVGVTGTFRKPYLCLAATAIVFLALAFLKVNSYTVPATLRLASFFLCGTCYYLYRRRVPMRGDVAAAVAVVTVAALFSRLGAEFVLASLGGYALLYAAEKRSPLLSHFNRLPDVSYGLYLYGWPTQKLLLWYLPSLSPLGLFALAAPIAIAFGTVSWYLVEKPALRLKGRTLPMRTEQKPEARPL